MHPTATPRARGAIVFALAFIAFSLIGSSPARAVFQSDDFHAAEIDTTLWNIIDPAGDATFVMTGTNLLVHVPGRSAHTLWNTCVCAPMLVQDIPDSDFELEAKFDAAVSEQYQIQGFVVREDSDTFLRFDVHYNGGSVRVFAAYVNGVNPPSIKINTSIAAFPPYLRLNRTGSVWTFSYSTDGAAWTTAGSFSRTLVASDAGVFVGNEKLDEYDTPAFTASIDYVFNTDSPIAPEDGGDPAAEFPPRIDVWYGTTQAAGTPGVPQDFANVLGTVWGPDGVASLAWSLNGGPAEALTVGPDGARLVGFGDFNIEVPYDDLLPGANSVVITATDTLGTSRDTTVTLDFTDGLTWPIPDTASWTTASSITDEGYVVDGRWELTGSGIRTAPNSQGYERLLVVGDRTWASDYEVTVPFTVHETGIGGASAVEVVVGWGGHTGSGQPRVNGVFQGFASLSDFGSAALLELRTTGANAVDTATVAAEVGQAYRIKIRSQSLGAGESAMKVRFWRDGDPEPSTWDAEGVVATRNGSVLLMADDADVTFGDVVTDPVPSLGHVLTTTSLGSGTIERSPDYALYPDSTAVTVTAVPDSGYAFLGWSDGLSGRDAEQQITIVSDTTVTASFVPAIQSDDFHANDLDTSLWRIFDPVGDTTVRMSGTNLLMDVTGGVSHDAWAGCNCAPRILQPSFDTDFEVEAKFDSRGRHLYQSQGIVVHEDDDTFLRFDVVYTASTVNVFSGRVDNGTAVSRLNHAPTVPPAYLRVTRQGDKWTLRYSADGSSWVVAGSYTQAMTVTEVGVMVANHNDDVFDTPAYTASIDYFMNTAARITPEDGGEPTAPTPPIVDVWYGDVRSVGQRGVPEDWWNIEGQIIDSDSIASLTWSLNGGPSAALNLGPDDLRLDGVGDFIVEVPNASLVSGANTVVITAVDDLGETTDHTVTLNYTPGGWWDLPYTADFTAASEVNELARDVTGLWALTPDGVRNATGRTGYDRLLVIGDRDWITDYEVEGTLIIHDGNLGGVAGIGYIVGWQGHEGSQQPRLNAPFQSAGWIRDFPADPRLELRDDEVVRGAVPVTIEADSTYRLRLRSEYTGATLRQVSVKIWKEGTAEPGWQLTDQFTARDGSLLLVSHQADVTFGQVTVTPLSHFPDNVITVNVVGGGRVERFPSQRAYLDGSQVIVTAVADNGWVFDSWSDGLSGTQVQDTLVLTTDTTITATFTQDQYTLTVNVTGSGTVTRSPDKAFYSPGEPVVLTADPDSAWGFCRWKGALTSTSLVDTVTVDSNTSVTAVFGRYGVDVTVVGDGTVGMSPDKCLYLPGEQVILTAVASPGKVFSSWGGDLSGSENPDTVTVDSTLSVTATFEDSPTPVGDTPMLTRLTVRHNTPNPFSSGTLFEYGLPSESDVEVNVYDAAGRRVFTRRVSAVQAGWHNFYFDGRDGRGRDLPSGVYFYRVQTRYATASRKMVIVR